MCAAELARSHVDMVDVRTWSTGVSRSHMEFYVERETRTLRVSARMWSFTFARETGIWEHGVSRANVVERRTPRANVKLHVRTSTMSTCAAHVEFHVRTWSLKKNSRVDCYGLFSSL